MTGAVVVVCAGYSARKILARQEEPAPSSRSTRCLMRSADTANTVGSSRIRLWFVVAEASTELATLDLPIVRTTNCPEELRAESISTGGSGAAEEQSKVVKEIAAKGRRRCFLIFWDRSLRGAKELVFCRAWAPASSRLRRRFFHRPRMLAQAEPPSWRLPYIS